ncbi:MULTISPECIES: AMP-binding protein [Paracoccus]|jgi:long-chain acyl-CoA synthetase|uniref:AMP-dependent synthetase and ligase n=1 Tax=Paracoccus denitrificans (strain Pd 1222) TaxID=318586 RepID=A1AY21_PARDP|nr:MULTISPECIES: AMP-binding protein [Paracoccus]ABL68165.1 AMP-dependent synthetase and ligase [Paracoccus denitrificans PD1222]MBB4627765.1 long-chain acyl-CoA synthetase [Paracoccus denitrificans]MCU7428885.1 AMP-binding protein [Paracoccus denitrificans]MDK8872536.1 AMP-binding protein [Paracoccus sp. SSJ]QAR26277.1 long-chain fatty acid--CoA ligase [Paracoccus denitrificans]
MQNAEAAQAGLQSIPALLARNAERFGDRPAYREKEFGIWQSWTWAEAATEIRDLALGFLVLGLNRGDHVAIIGRNRPAHYWAMVAAQMCGAVPVPLYQDAVAEEMAYVLDHCGARFVVCGDQEQVDKVLEVGDRAPSVQHLVYTDKRGMRKYDHARMNALADVQAEGRAAQQRLGHELDERIAELGYDDTCVMLYTSGTTGKPKGVVLSNRNIIETGKNTASFDQLTAREEVLAYLPMAWVGDFIFSVGQAYWAGFTVNCPEGAHTMMTDLREIGPTYFFAPPRVFEGQLTSVMIRMEDASRIKRRLFKHYMEIARRIGPALLDGKPVGALDRLRYMLGNLLVYGPLKNTLGYSRIRVGYTAGEAIGPEIFDFYRSLGINLKQLYGQTEASVFITQQPDGQVRSDTVGVPSPGVELKIAENGEVFYRSPGTFVEYYNNPDSTASTKDAEGWVATGDAGFFEEESGHLRIIDRAKDVGRMADGRMFAPKYVENKLKFYPNILEAVVFGAGRDMCTAFVNIDLTAVGNWAERNNIAYASYQELAGHPQVYATIKEHVEAVNESVAQDPMLSGCQISRFLVLHKELDPDDGEMTRTRKVRRNIIAEKYADLIEALYDGRDTVSTRTEVTYEDGRKGEIRATLKIEDARTFPTRTMQKVAAE